MDHRGGDQNGTRECIVGDMYRKRAAIETSAAGHVLDIGANGAGFPLMLLLEGVTLASVVGVEVNPATYSRLLVNLQSNLGPSAVAINAAVCGLSASQEILLTPSRGGTGYSIRGNTVGDSAQGIPVKTTTLEALYNQYFSARNIGICKINIEGAEYDLLDSSHDDVLLKIRYLLIEFHDNSRSPAAIRRFAQIGFSGLIQTSSGTTSAPPGFDSFAGQRQKCNTLGVSRCRKYLESNARI